MRRVWRLVWLLVLAPSAATGLTPTVPITPPVVRSSCIGDCTGDGRVTIDELVTLVAIGLGNLTVAACPAVPDDPRTVSAFIAPLVEAVHNALYGCPAASATPTSGTVIAQTPTATPQPTATSCRAVIPVVAPVQSPTDALVQTIYLCGIGFASSRVNACGPAGCVEEYVPAGDACPLHCPDSRQACVAGIIPLLPDQPNALEVCQVPGIGCGVLPDLCAEEDVNGDPLVIEQRPTGE